MPQHMQKRHRIICRRIDAFDRKSRHAPLIVVYFVGKERKMEWKKAVGQFINRSVRNEFIETIISIFFGSLLWSNKTQKSRVPGFGGPKISIIFQNIYLVNEREISPSKTLALVGIGLGLYDNIIIHSVNNILILLSMINSVNVKKIDT